MMRKNILYILVTAFLAVACFEERFQTEPTPNQEVDFSAGLFGAQTKTLYGKDEFSSVQNSIKIKWVDGDLVKVYGTTCSCKQAEYAILAPTTPDAPNTPNKDDGKSTADGMVKTGEAGVQWGSDPASDFYAVYPSGSTGDFVSYNGGTKVKTTISATQYNSFIKSGTTWQGVPFDFSDKTMRMNNAIMYARTTANSGESVDLVFNPFTTVLKFKLASWESVSGSGLGGNATGKSIQVKSITIKAPYAIAGDFDLMFPASSSSVSASLANGYSSSSSVVITPAEQLTWTYGESIEFSVFTIPVSNRKLSDVDSNGNGWSIRLETNEGTKLFNLKPSSTSKSNLVAGKIHKLGLPGIPITTPWEPSKDNWIESIPRNVYLSELSLPGAWYSTDENYQGSDIGLHSDSNKDGIDDGLAALYNAGIRAFHIDSRLSVKPGVRISDSYSMSDMSNLVLACAGTEVEGGIFNRNYLESIGMTVEDALNSLGQLISQDAGQDEFIEVILTVSNKPKTNGSREYGTVDPTMVLTAISNLVNQSSIKSYLYTDQITPNTVVNNVLGKIVLKVNVNATDATIRKAKVSGPMLVSEGSMAETRYGNNNDIMLGTFNKDNTVLMHWSNIYKDKGQDGYMLFHYHQCQDTESSITVAERKTAIWEILKTAKANYNADTHNALYQLGIGGWTDDDAEGKADIASKLSPFVNEIIECMLDETSYTYNSETYKMYPTPVGAVLMNFALKDQIKISASLGGSTTYAMNSSTLIQNIINLNAKCPMSRDEDQPAWPGTEPDPEPDYVGDIYVEILDWDDEHLN